MIKLRLMTQRWGSATFAFALVAAGCSGEESMSGMQPTAFQPPSTTPLAGGPAPVGMPSAGDPTQMVGGPSAVMGPNVMDPNGTNPNAMDPNAVDPTAMDPTAMDPTTMDPNAMDPTAMDPTAMDPTTMDPVPVEPPVCEATAPDEFEPNPSVGGGGGSYVDSPHFRIYDASQATAQEAIKQLEAAYSCFVEDLCWRSSGLSINGSDDGPFYKMNIYGVGSLGGAAGQMFSDARAGLSYLRVVNSYLPAARVSVHEYGHALTYHEQGWIDQTNTGAWWETVANFVADTHLTSPLCADARERHGLSEGDTLIELNKVISDSHQVIVDGSQGSGNYYQAWPLLTYITNNPDGYTGLGPHALRDMFRNHARNNETPLHVLERVADPTSVQTIVGRYWARMAYLDIGHPKAQAAFFSSRGRLNFSNLDSAGGQSYRVKSSRQPRYFGANIIPLKGSGDITVQVTSDAPFTATLAIYTAATKSARYIDLDGGAGQATLAAGEEASLVVVNTPDTLYTYDPFRIGGDVARGLDYQVEITGATP